MSLTIAAKLSVDDQVLAFLRGWVAFDPETGNYLYKSNGRRKAGRPTKYYLHLVDGMPKTFTAISDIDALNKCLGGE